MSNSPNSLSAPFISTLADRIAEQDVKKWHQSLVILPSRRAALYLQKALFKRAGQAFLHPLILTGESWALELAGGTRLEAAAELSCLYQVYRETYSDPESFDAFLQWAPLFLSDLNEAHRYLCDIPSLYRFTADIRRLERWNVQSEDQRTPMVQRYLRFWEGLEKTAELFTEQCIRSGSLPQGVAYRIAAEQFEERWPKWRDKNRIEKIFVAGLNALNRAEESMLHQLSLDDNCQFLWDLPRILEKDEQEAGRFIRKYTSVWKDRSLSVNEKEGARDWTILSSPGATAQLQLAGDILEELIQKEGVEVLERTALILADESLLLPALNALPSEVTQANVTMGFSIADHPITAIIAQLLELYADLSEERIRTGLAEEMLNRLSSLGLSVPENNFPKHHCPTEVWDEWWESFSNGPSLQGIRNGIEAAEILLTWLKVKLGNQVLHQVISELSETIDQLKGLLEALPHEVRKLHIVFSLLGRGSKLSFAGEPLQGLQIMGILESRALEFDYLICTSINEGILPMGRPVNSLFPPEVRRSHKLPDHGEKDSIYGYHFLRLLARSKKAWLLYNSSHSGLSNNEPSRFLLQVEREWPKQLADLQVSSKAANMPAADTRSNISISKTEESLRRLREMAEKGFSPSGLHLYLSDPVQFYLRYLSGIKDDRTMKVLDPAALGTLFHDSMCNLYAGFKDRPLREADLKKALSRTDEVLMDICSKNGFEPKKLFGQEGLNLDMLRELLKSSIELDLQMLKDKSTTLLKLEEWLEKPLAQDIAIRGISDRIDREDGMLRILDYKTGYVDRKALVVKDLSDVFDGEHAMAFQLLCYASMLSHTFDESPVRCGIFLTREWSKGPAMLKVFKSEEISREIIEEFEGLLLDVIREILDPNTPFKARDEYDTLDDSDSL